MGILTWIMAMCCIKLLANETMRLIYAKDYVNFWTSRKKYNEKLTADGKTTKFNSLEEKLKYFSKFYQSNPEVLIDYSPGPLETYGRLVIAVLPSVFAVIGVPACLLGFLRDKLLLKFPNVILARILCFLILTLSAGSLFLYTYWISIS